MKNKLAEKQLNKRTNRAKEILSDPDESRRLLSRADEKLKKARNRSVLSSVPGMLEMLKSYTRKEYSAVPLGTILGILAAVIYFVSPVDMIPDFIPFLGLVDDAGVIAFCISLFQYDLINYEEWKQKAEQADVIEAEYREQDSKPELLEGPDLPEDGICTGNSEDDPNP